MFRPLFSHHQGAPNVQHSCLTCVIKPNKIHFSFLLYFTKLSSTSRKEIQLGAQLCVICLFISPLYKFRASMRPTSGENYWVYATVALVTLYGRRLVCRLDWNSIQPADQTLQTQSDKCQCRIDTIIFSWWWAHGRSKHVEKRSILTFRHRASCILEQAFHYSPENAFYIFN